MRRATRISHAVAVIALGAIALGAVAESARAESHTEDEELASWLPILGISFDVHTQSFDVSGHSDLTGSSDPGYTRTQTENVVTSVLSVDVGVMTPALMEGFGAPRLFVQAGIQAPLSDEFAGLRSNTSFPPIGVDTPAGQLPTPEACPGLGDMVTVPGPGGDPVDATIAACNHELDSTLTMNFNWSAGIGAEFTIPTPSRSFKIRTALEYFGQSWDFKGKALRQDRVLSGPLTIGQIGRSVELGGASTSKTIHALGPRVTFVGEVGRAGPLSFGVFAEARFYWLLNGKDIKYSTSNADGTASFVADPDPLIAQGGAGLRITWVGSQ